MATKWKRALLVVAAGVGLLCCSPIDGRDPYALWKTYTHPGGLFHFHYLSPPWEKQSSSSSNTVRYVVEVDGIPLDELGLPGDGMESRLSMTVSVYSDTPAFAAAWLDLGDWLANGAVAEAAEGFQSESGVEGLNIRGEGRDRFFSAVYHDLSGGGSVSMIVVGKEDVHTSDIRLLLQSLEPALMTARGPQF